jgi:hypothetical protein
MSFKYFSHSCGHEDREAGLHRSSASRVCPTGFLWQGQHALRPTRLAFIDETAASTLAYHHVRQEEPPRIGIEPKSAATIGGRLIRNFFLRYRVELLLALGAFLIQASFSNELNWNQNGRLGATFAFVDRYFQDR